MGLQHVADVCNVTCIPSGEYPYRIIYRMGHTLYAILFNIMYMHGYNTKKKVVVHMCSVFHPNLSFNAISYPGWKQFKVHLVWVQLLIVRLHVGFSVSSDSGPLLSITSVPLRTTCREWEWGIGLAQRYKVLQQTFQEN